jgi:hypothetical protein
MQTKVRSLSFLDSFTIFILIVVVVVVVVVIVLVMIFFSSLGIISWTLDGVEQGEGFEVGNLDDNLRPFFPAVSLGNNADDVNCQLVFAESELYFRPDDYRAIPGTEKCQLSVIRKLERPLSSPRSYNNANSNNANNANSNYANNANSNSVDDNNALRRWQRRFGPLPAHLAPPPLDEDAPPTLDMCSLFPRRRPRFRFSADLTDSSSDDEEAKAEKARKAKKKKKVDADDYYWK